MKNIILIICFSFVVLACSKEESNHEPKVNFPEHLIGKWKMTACEHDSGIDSTYPCGTQVTQNIYDIWFKEDGTYESKTIYPCDNCEYKVEKIKIFPDKEGEFVIYFGSNNNRGVHLIKITENELIHSYVEYSGFDDNPERRTYTRVE